MSPGIVSFSPVATEIICALGLGSNMVGRSSECDFPDSVKPLPVVTTTAPDSLANPPLWGPDQLTPIDKINVRVLNQLVPDMIFTVNERAPGNVPVEDIKAAVKFLIKDEQIISLKPEGLDDLFDNITTIAQVLGVEGEGIKLKEDLQDRVDLIRHKLKYMDNKPVVACIESLEPLMIAGNRMLELVSIAGGTAVLPPPDNKTVGVEWEAIQLLNPDVLLLMCRGFSIEDTLKNIDLLIQMPAFGELSAVKNKRIYITDGKQSFDRPGPGVVDSIEILAEIIHPRQFIFGYEGKGWIKFDF